MGARVEFNPGRREFLEFVLKFIGVSVLTLPLKGCQPSPERKIGLNLPLDGRITQGFWKGHQAIDIYNSEGTPVLAAANGIILTVETTPVKLERFLEGTGVYRRVDGAIGRIERWTLERVGVGLGKYIVLGHEGGFTTVYGHLREFTVKKGEKVLAGEKIGEVGSTGRSTGVHLHFELRKGEEKVDPRLYLDVNCK